MQRLAKALASNGATTQVLEFNKYACLRNRPILSLFPSPKLLPAIVSFHPDIVFTDIYNYDSWGSKLAAYPILAHMRGDYWTEFTYLYLTRTRYSSLFMKWATFWLKFVTERGIDFAHTILPICGWLAKQVKEHRPRKRIRVLYQPIEPRIWLREQSEERIVLKMVLKHPAVISVFDFNILPKVQGFIRFLNVTRKMPQLNFYIAGSGPYFNHVLSQNPPQNVKFLGQLPYPNGVKAFLKTGDLYVHPSGQDACPLTVMEAELMKMAVVATDVGGVPEVVGDKRFLVKDGDTEGWMSKIQYLLDHPEERERAGSVNRHYIETGFSMDKIAGELFVYMKEVLEKDGQ